MSYGRTFVTSHPMRIASLAVGYADGFPRQVSGRAAHVLIGGVRCSVLGRVTMDQILVDVTKLPEVAAGDEAVLIGRQGERGDSGARIGRKGGNDLLACLHGNRARGCERLYV